MLNHVKSHLKRERNRGNQIKASEAQNKHKAGK